MSIQTLKTRLGAGTATLEAAVAGAAAAAVAARLDALLAIEPHLPDASGEALTEAVLQLEAELLETVPDQISVQVLGAEARTLPLVFGLMANDDELRALGGAGSDDDPNDGPRLRAGNTGETGLTRLGRNFASALHSGGNPTATLRLLATDEGAALLDAGARCSRCKWLPAPGPPRCSAACVSWRCSCKAAVSGAASQAVTPAPSAWSARWPAWWPVRTCCSTVPASASCTACSVWPAPRAPSSRCRPRAPACAWRARGWRPMPARCARRRCSHAAKCWRARAPIAADVSGDRFPVAADVRGLPAGRRLVIRGTRRDNGQELVHDATLVSATPAAHSADGGLIVFTPSLPVPLVRTSVVVHGNVAVASHGETVAQVLGSGDAAQQHQRFALAHAPLTHRAAATESGAVAELEVRVGDVAWQHRNTLYATGANDRVFTTLTDEQGKVWVQFGDGVSGARLPSSAHNLRARYRKGLGVDGNVRAEALSQAMARPLGFKGVSNPAAASGGTDAETSEVARRSMPLVTRTLGRVVSVLDYEDFARAYAGIAKAQARVLRLPGVAQGSVVALTVAATAGAPLAAGNPVWANLLAALKDSGDPHVALRLLPAEQRHYRVGLKVKVDAAYEAAVVLPRVEAALRAQGAFDARELGQPVHASDVIAAAQAVPGVVAVDLDFLCFAGTLPQLRSTLRAAPTRAVGAQALPAQVLVLDPGPLLRLEVMA
jgi:predicted phage baseplate assembly protein